MQSIPDGRGDSQKLLLFQNVELSKITVCHVQEPDRNPIIFSILEHIKATTVLEFEKKNWPWVLFQSHATPKLVSLGIRIICIICNKNVDTAIEGWGKVQFCKI